MPQSPQSEPSPPQPPSPEQEPIVFGDRYGLVIVWPDRYVRRFSWETLRQEGKTEDKLTPSQEHY